MADPEVEAASRAEFKRVGQTQLLDALNSGIADEPMRQAAFRWLGDEAEERQLREEENTPLCPLDLLRRYRCLDRWSYRCGLNVFALRNSEPHVSRLAAEARRSPPLPAARRE